VAETPTLLLDPTSVRKRAKAYFDAFPHGGDYALGVDPTVVSPAAISITAVLAACSYRGRTDHTG
jgi:hypothetical protein